MRYYANQEQLLKQEIKEIEEKSRREAQFEKEHIRQMFMTLLESLLET